MEQTIYEILTNINNVVLYLIGIPFALQMIFMLLFWVDKRIYPKSEKKNKFAILIPARNEEGVIKDTIEDLYKNQNYPRELYDVYVVCHNCTDYTYEKVLEAGAIPIKAESEIKRAYVALDAGIKYILNSGKEYDIFMRLDADNRLNSEFMNLMNDAINAGCEIVRPYESALNMSQTGFTQACGLYYIFDSRFASHAREFLGLQAHVNGPGSCFKMSVIKDIGGYDCTNICEDTEFYFKRMLEGRRMNYCEDAIVYEDLPSTMSDTYNRNRRLASGNIRLFKYFPRFIWEFLRTFDFSFLEQILTFLFIPICPVLCTWLPCYYIYALIYLSSHGMMTQFWMIIWIIIFCLLFLFFFAGLIQGFLLVLLDYKKMGAKKRSELYKGVLLFPFFSMIYIITITFGIFTKPKWNQIKRNNKKKDN